MKKLKTTLIISVLCLAIIGCGKKDSLVGAWERTSQESDVSRTTTFEFKNDKTGVWTLSMGLGAGVTKEFTYKSEDNKITIAYKDGTPQIEYEYKLNGSFLILKDDTGKENKFTKK